MTGSMKRIVGSALLFMLVAALHGPAEGAQVLVVFSSDIYQYRLAFEGFRKAFEKKGVACDTTEYDMAREVPEVIIRQIEVKRPDLVLAIGPEAAKLARVRVRNIPVVFLMVLHPEAFAGPNTTGVSLKVPFRLKLDKIARILPAVRRIGMLYSLRSAAEYREVAQACRDLGFQLVARQIESGSDFPKAFRDISSRVEAFIMIPDTAIYFPKSIEYLLSESIKSRLPVIGLSSSYTKAGALISFDEDYLDVGRRAGDIAIRIIQGEKPASIALTRAGQDYLFDQ